ncbi:MAG: hypothetical protein AAF431_07035 [Pseudomonadota bacterium]
MELETISAALNQNAGAYVEFLIKSLAGIALVGTLSMALVQAFKGIPFLPFREKFFQQRTEKFLRDLSKDNSWHEIEEVIYRYGAGSKKAFYKQSLEEIAQGMVAAKNIALARPSKAELTNFLRFFEDVGRPKYNSEECSLVTALLELIAISEPSHEQKENIKSINSYLSLMIGGYIDGFKVTVNQRWTFWQQFAAIVLSVCFVLMWVPIEEPLFQLIYGILGGMLAPFVHDLIKKLKPLI